jgi:hypothetical protein
MLCLQDDIERLLEYVAIGPRFSNVVLQVHGLQLLTAMSSCIVCLRVKSLGQCSPMCILVAISCRSQIAALLCTLHAKVVESAVC